MGSAGGGTASINHYGPLLISPLPTLLHLQLLNVFSAFVAVSAIICREN